MSSESLSFGTWLRREMERRDLSQSDLARRIGTSTANVARWANDKVEIQPPMARKVAAALGYSDEYVMYLAGHLERLPSPPAQYERAAWAEWIGRLDARYEDVEVTEQGRIVVQVYGYIPADNLRLTEPMTGIEPLRVLPEMVAGARSPFALIASGDCMSSEGIVTGDYVILDRPDGREPRDQQIVAVRVNREDVTLKRWIVGHAGIELHDGDGNVVYRVSPVDEVEVIGLYVWHCPPLPKSVE